MSTRGNTDRICDSDIRLNAVDKARFLVVDKLQSSDDTLRIDPDEDLDRLSGISDSVGEIGIEIDEPLQLIAAIDMNDWRIALRRTEVVGSRKHVGQRDLREIGGKLARGMRRLRP